MDSYNYALSPTSQFYFCGVPFRLDTTPKCDLNCLYCFAMARGGRRTSRHQIANPRSIHFKLQKSVSQKIKRTGIVEEMLSYKYPLHFGGISDPFSNIMTSITSLKLLEILSNFNYPVVLSTKNTKFLLKDETMNILKKLKYLVVQVSISIFSEKTSKAIEPFSPSPKDRINCINFLSKHGINTMCRLQPLIPIWIDEIGKDLLPRLGEAGCKHVIVEFLKLPVEKNISLIDNIFNSINWNGYDYYRENKATLVGREWLLPNKFRWENLQSIITIIHKHGMTYGAGDYGLNHLGDTDCCCGIDKIEGFSKWFKYNFSNIIRQSKTKYIRLPKFQNTQCPSKSIAVFMNSKCRLPKNNTIQNYLATKWNRPGTINAPDTFFGVSWQKEYDNDGNCIYYREV